MGVVEISHTTFFSFLGPGIITGPALPLVTTKIACKVSYIRQVK